MILIVAPKDDIHARAVAAALARVGVPNLHSSIEDMAADMSVQDDHVSVGFVHTVWYRRIGSIPIDPSVAPADRSFVRGETAAMLLGVAEILETQAFAINPLHTALMNERGCGKLNQLRLARIEGITVPATLATNNPNRAKGFLSVYPDSVYKPFSAPVTDGKTIFTSRVTSESLDSVTRAPCIFQERIPKQADIRVVIMGSECMAVSIHSTETDFRLNYDVPHRPHTLPPMLRYKLLSMMKSLGLVFGCVDLLLTPEGDYVFLEINQQGNWLWLDSTIPVLESFVGFIQGDYRGP